MTTYLFVYIASTFLALGMTPLVIWVARRTKALDQPGVRTMHETPVPRIGGVAIFVAAMALVVCGPLLDNRVGEAFREKSLELGTLLCTATFIFLIGLVDDLKGLAARFKLLAELIAAAAVCFAGIQIEAIAIGGGLVLDLGFLAVPLTMLWIVGIANAVNLSDGLDGLAAGVSAVACAVIAIFAIHSDTAVMAVLTLAMLGSLSGFLFFNFNPAKVFMGDCGSLFIGYMIASSSVMCFAKSSALVGLALPALALGIPIFDTFFSMLRRFLERRSLFAPDRSHFHHRLIDLGLTQRHAVLTIYGATCLAAGLGLFMMIRRDIGSLLVFVCILILVVLLFRVVGAVRFRESLLKLQQNHALMRQRRSEKKTFEHLQLRLRQVHASNEWWDAICDAAESLDFAWVSLRVSNGNGVEETLVWRGRATPDSPARLVTMNLPLVDAASGRTLTFEIAVTVNGSLEAASHRAGLFSRLVDEHGSNQQSQITSTS